jgi:hypothetical protein
MTEEQQMAGIKSLAVELDRLAHAIDVPDDDTTDQALNLAIVVQALGGGKLCSHELNALAKLTHYLVELEHHHDDEHGEAH